MATESKRFKVDFYVITKDGSRDHAEMQNLLLGAAHVTPALALDGNEDEKYQIRSIVQVGSAFKAVFGRIRSGDKPVQGNELGQEEDVDLKPGHGLVEKNHFIFHPDRNLLIYERNGSGSHYAKVQRYLNLLLTQGVYVLEPLLTRDSYQKLIDGGDAKTVDFSFQAPRDPSLYQGSGLEDVIRMLKGLGGLNARVRIGVGRSDKRLTGKAKDAAVAIAKHGLARVARVTLADDAEPIDLIADRIIESASVPKGANGRPSSEDVYAALQNAADKRDDDLATFFGG